MTRTTNARFAGAMFLFYIAVGITQMVLSRNMSAEGTTRRLLLIAQHATQVRVNILLTLITCLTALALAVALYGLTRDEDGDLAVLALSCRVGEGLLAAIAPLASLGLLWLATMSRDNGSEQSNLVAELFFRVRVWNTLISATLFAMGSTIFSWLLLRGRLIPTFVAWLGVLASVLLLVALPLQLIGFLTGSITQLIWIPMAAFEIPLGVWLLIKGVRS